MIVLYAKVLLDAKLVMENRNHQIVYGLVDLVHGHRRNTWQRYIFSLKGAIFARSGNFLIGLL